MTGNPRRRIPYPLPRLWAQMCGYGAGETGKHRFCGGSQLRRCGSTEGSQPFVPGCRGGSALLGSRGNAHWQVKGGSHYRVKDEVPWRVEGSRPIGSRVKRLAQGELMPASTRTGYYLTQNSQDLRLRRPSPAPEHLRRREEICLKLTRHNGRSGKHGTYNPRHNDRRFDVENSEHIDAERARQNVYWDCYRGFTTMSSGRTRSSRISALKKLSGCTTTSITAAMWRPRTPGMRKPATSSATAPWRTC